MSFSLFRLPMGFACKRIMVGAIICIVARPLGLRD